MPVGMHDALTDGARQLDLRAGLFIYHTHEFPATALVMAHDVEQGDGPPRPTAGYPLTREHANRLARTILGAMPTRTILQENVLVWDGIRLAWWTPQQRRRIWFSKQDRPQLQHVSRQEVTHPALLWVADPGRLHLYALAEDARPAAETPLFQAPYLNVYEDGWVCGEGVQWPRVLGPESIPDWERAVFDSEGTKVWARKLTLYPGGHDALWTAMRAAERFPAETLVTTGLKVLDAINYERPAFYGQKPPREEIVPARALP